MAGPTTCTDVFTVELCVCWCKCVYSGLFTSLLWTPTVTQSLECLTDAWHWARTQTCCSCFSPPTFPSIHCAAQPQLGRSHRGILLLVDSGPQDTEPSFHGDFTNTPGPERTSLWQGGTMETGTDHKGQFLGIPVPGITPVVLQTPEEQWRQRCWRSEGDAVFQGALWLIGEKQSGHSCQMHRMNANRPMRMLKSAFFRKKSGEVWTDKSVDRGTD